MRILYVFPHPDDESFGPAATMARQRRQGHEVYMLTLTRGGATKQRFRLGLSIEEMGEVRYKEMLEVERVLGLSGMNVLDLPDSGLKEMDPREIERVVMDEIERLRPDVVVTYPVHGVSLLHDHLVMHAIAKRVFVESRERNGYPRRLAFYTLGPDANIDESKGFALQKSKPEEIDCVIELDDEDLDAKRRALACYVSYQEVIEKARVMEVPGRVENLEFFMESFDPPLADMFDKLPDQ